MNWGLSRVLHLGTQLSATNSSGTKLVVLLQVCIDRYCMRAKVRPRSASCWVLLDVALASLTKPYKIQFTRCAVLLDKMRDECCLRNRIQCPIAVQLLYCEFRTHVVLMSPTKTCTWSPRLLLSAEKKSFAWELIFKSRCLAQVSTPKDLNVLAMLVRKKELRCGSFRISAGTTTRHDDSAQPHTKQALLEDPESRC